MAKDNFSEEFVKGELEYLAAFDGPAEPVGLAMWSDIGTAPRDATWIEVRMKDGTTKRVHWAEDLSGEEQPPFRGWFERRGNYYAEVVGPVEWRSIQP